ncbi:MAG TPA: hypothetical protein VFB73_09390 [Chloroflexota bacterium]|nr:hypothetical protein [Chloroflexota bacterium]
MAKTHWSQGALQQPGALRQTARRLGLIPGDAPLSAGDLARLARHAERTGNPRLARQGEPGLGPRFALARTLRRLRDE